MPAVINGIGTWYYGRDRIHTLRGVCEFCGRPGDLTSYDTTTYFTFVYIPIIPLGKKRILEQCSSCRKHRVVTQRNWEEAKAKDSGAVLEKLQANPNDRDAIMHAISLATSYQDQALFDRVAQTLANDRSDDAGVQSMLGQGFEYFSRTEEAESAYRQALRAEDSAADRERLGLNLLKQGRPDDAEPCLAHCYESPNGARTLYWLVAGYQAVGQHDDALRVIDAAFAKFPDLATNKDWLQRQKTSSKYRTTSKRIAAPLLGASSAAGYREGGWRAKAPRYVLPALLLAAFLIYLGVAVYRGHARSVYLLSGVPIPYVATVNGVDYNLGAGHPISVQVPEGNLTVAIKAPGVPPEEQTCRIETPFWSRPFVSRTFVLNPDRVAILVRETTIYSKQPVRQDEPDRRFTGQLLHEFQDIDYEFAQFPRTIEVKGGGEFKKHRVDLLPPIDAQNRLLIALEGHTLPEAQEIARRWLTFQPNDSTTLLWLTMQLGPEAAVAFIKPRLADRPLRPEWHRAYQVSMERGKPDQDLIPEYRALVAETKRAPDAVYLLARLCPRDECLKLLKEAAGAKPPSHLAEYSLGYHALSDGKFNDAVGWCRKAATAVPGDLVMQRLYELSLWATKAYSELLRLTQTRLAVHPDSAADLLLQAKLLVALGNRVDADAKLQDFMQRLGPVPPEQSRFLANSLNLFDALFKRDAPAYLQATEAAGQTGSFIDALLRDQPQTAAGIVRQSNDVVDGSRFGMLFICAQRLGNAGIADEAFAQYVAALRRSGREERACAAILSSAAPTAEQLRVLGMEVDAKRVALTVAIRKFPKLRDDLAPLATRLNFEFDADGLFLAKELR